MPLNIALVWFGIAAYLVAQVVTIRRLRRLAKAQQHELRTVRRQRDHAQAEAALWNQLMRLWRSGVVAILSDIDPEKAEALKQTIARMDADHETKRAMRRVAEDLGATKQ